MTPVTIWEIPSTHPASALGVLHLGIIYVPQHGILNIKVEKNFIKVVGNFHTPPSPTA